MLQKEFIANRKAEVSNPWEGTSSLTTPLLPVAPMITGRIAALVAPWHRHMRLMSATCVASVPGQPALPSAAQDTVISGLAISFRCDGSNRCLRSSRFRCYRSLRSSLFCSNRKRCTFQRGWIFALDRPCPLTSNRKWCNCIHILQVKIWRTGQAGQLVIYIC